MYLKKISQVILLLLILFSGVFSLISITSASKNEIIVKKEVPEKQLKELSFAPIVQYSENATKKVRSKLDSLLKRIHKRHDFHGTILVAKDEKIIYQNQILITP